MAFWVYILRCCDDTYYTGHTDNLDNRIGEHQSGVGQSYTSSRLPVELVWTQECSTRDEALAAEMQIKGLGSQKERSHDARRLERCLAISQERF